MLGTRGSLVVRWLIHGFQQRPGGDVERGGDPGHPSQPARLQGRHRQPAADRRRADGRARLGRPRARASRPGRSAARYLVARTIRMFVERWDRTALGEQEAIIGRTKRTGAPARQGPRARRPGLRRRPAWRADRRSTPTSGWRTRGRPRPQPSRILRRGYSFSRGFDDAGLLDEGLFFVAFQRDLERGFVAVQNRLSGEPLEEYIQPVGGGYFFVPPGHQRPATPSRASRCSPDAGQRSAGQAGARPEAPVGPEAIGGARRPPHTNRIRHRDQVPEVADELERRRGLAIAEEPGQHRPDRAGLRAGRR